MCQTEKNPRLDLPKGCEELLDDDWEKKKKDKGITGRVGIARNGHMHE